MDRQERRFGLRTASTASRAAPSSFSVPALKGNASLPARSAEHQSEGEKKIRPAAECDSLSPALIGRRTQNHMQQIASVDHRPIRREVPRKSGRETAEEQTHLTWWARSGKAMKQQRDKDFNGTQQSSGCMYSETEFEEVAFRVERFSSKGRCSHPFYPRDLASL